MNTVTAKSIAKFRRTKVRGGVISPVRPAKDSPSAKACAAQGCENKFIPGRSDQIYCSVTCNNREKQRRLRERARMGMFDN